MLVKQVVDIRLKGGASRDILGGRDTEEDTAIRAFLLVSTAPCLTGRPVVPHNA